jgi:hypothetical protein
MRFFNKRRARLVREDGPRRIQVQPKNAKTKSKQQQQQIYPSNRAVKTKLSPPPDYNQAIKSISGMPGPSQSRGNFENYRSFNGR